MSQFREVFGVLLLVALLSVNAFASPEILALLPMSGGSAKWGDSIQKGIQLALEGSELAARVEDHEGKPAQAASAFESGVHENTKAVICFGSATSLAVAQKAQDRKVPFVAIATSDLIQKDRPFVFRHMISASRVADLLVPELRKRDLKRVAVVSTIHEGMNAFRAAFLERYKEPLVANEEVPIEERDLRAVAFSIVRQKPDAIYEVLLAPQGSLFAKAIRNLGYKGEIFAANQADDSSEFAAAGESFEGLWFTRDGDETRENFANRYRERFGVEPETFAFNAYDVSRAILLGIRSGDVQQFLAGLHDFQGALGSYGMGSDRAFQVPGSLWVVHRGHPIPLR